MSRDALIENYPIEIPGGEHLVINTSTAPIIYNKGASLLRQIEGYISEHTDAVFSHGLCSSCAAVLYPGIFKAKDATQRDDFKL